MTKRTTKITAICTAFLIAVISMLQLFPLVKVTAADSVTWNGHRYHVFDESISWTEARIRCAVMGGHLVAINTEEEQEFVNGLIKNGEKQQYWIGLYRENKEWNWIDSSPYAFQNWDYDEITDKQKPDNKSGDEQFGAIYAKTISDETQCFNFGKWDDMSDEGNGENSNLPLSSFGYICEWDNTLGDDAYGISEGVLIHGEHTYQIFESNVKWEDAQKACEAIGGHLASITSEAELKALGTLISNYGEKSAYWLGATDKTTEGQWLWLTGEEFDYTNWNKNAPDDKDKTQNYLGINNKKNDYGASLEWNDFSNADIETVEFGYICEWENDSKSVTWNDHTYKYYDLGFAWDDARAYCELMGGHLVTITSSEEQKAVESLFGEKSKNNYWMGAKVRDKKIHWVTGEEAEYSNWAYAQPDNCKGIGEDSLMMYLQDNPYAKDERFQWNDLREDGTCKNETFFGLKNFGFICEWEDVSDTVTWNGHTYKYFDLGFTWDEAKAYCELLGGHLATITSDAEQKAIETLFGKETKNNYWLGAKVINKTINWITGEKTDFTNWAKLQPDNCAGINEDSLMMYLRVNPVLNNNIFEWNDARADGVCGTETFFGAHNFGLVCEWDNTDDVPGYIEIKPTVTTTVNVTTTTAKTTTTAIKITTKAPVTTIKTTTTVNNTTTSKATTTTQSTDILRGDANCDKMVDIADVVIIKCYLINSKDYSITKQGLINADVNESGNGLNIKDSLAVLKYILKLISSL